MNKSYFSLALLLGLVMSVSLGASLVHFSPSNDEVTFQVLYTGTPDQYGNQILNVTLDQWTGTYWTDRGNITSNTYAVDSTITGLFNQSVRFRVWVALNHSWADNTEKAKDFTNIIFSISGEVTNELMTVNDVELVAINQGWLLEYEYVWDEEGKPEVTTYEITLAYQATGPSQNYDLTYYDADFSMTSTHWVDGSNTTDLDWYQYCTASSDGDIITVTQNDGGETGFIAADDGITIDTSDYPFFQFSVTEVSGCNWRITFHNGTDWTYPYNFRSDTGTFTINLEELTDDPTLLRFQSSNATIGDYIKIDFYDFYKMTDYITGSSGLDHHSAVFLDQGNLNASLTFDDAGNEYLPLTYNTNIDAGDTLVIEYAITGDLQIYVYIDYVSLGTDAFALTTSGSWQSYSFDLKDDEIDYLFISFDDQPNSASSGTHTASIKWVYVEDYGFLNQSLDNNGPNTYATYDNDIDTLYQGYSEITDSDYHFTSTGFKPMHNLGSATVALWIVVVEPEYDYIYFSQYVDDNNRFEIGFDGDTEYSGNMTFTIGNSSEYVRVEAPIITHNGAFRRLHCVIVSWEKGGYLSLTVNGTEYLSDTILTGVISANDDLFIGPRDGSGDGIGYYYGVSMYYRELSDTEKGLLYAGGPEETSHYLYHGYSFNEVLLGYSATFPLLHDGIFTSAIRETWTFDFINQDLSSYLFPWPHEYPMIYLWLGGTFTMISAWPVFITLSRYYYADKKKGWYMKIFWAFGVCMFAFFMGANIFMGLATW